MSKIRRKLRVGSRTYKILRLLGRLGTPITFKEFFLATPHKELNVNREGLKRMQIGGFITILNGAIRLTPQGRYILDEIIDPRNIVVKQLTSYVWIGICH